MNINLRAIAFAICGVLAACGGSESNEETALENEEASALKAGMPCAVQPVVEKYCGTCHGATPVGSPMALASYQDFQAKASDGSSMRERILAKLHDPKLPMPPAARPQPKPEELIVLEQWLKAGAQRSVDKCNGTAAPAAPAQALPPLVPDSECEMIIELRAHGGQTLDNTRYEVPAGSEGYECFYFSVPFQTKTHLLKMEPLVDNASVLHHFLLYQDEQKQAPDGSHNRCAGAHPTSALLTGWAPGGPPASMPPDVGMQVAHGNEAQFNLEIHYNNLAGAPNSGDRSGVRLCATSKLRKNEAATHWLGTELIINPPGPGSATSTCAPQQTAHIINVSPHMHRTGRHMKTDILRSDGRTEILTDRPFDFNDQQIYPVGGAAGEVIVNPGDMLTTTCSYENDTGRLVTFGSNTSQEMCYNFVVAWPAGALATGAGLVGGPNRCMR